MPSLQSLVAFFERTCPRGIYPKLGAGLKCLEDRYTLYQQLLTHLQKSCGLSKESRSLAEGYQCLWFVLALLLLVFVSFGLSSWGYLAGALALCILTTLLFFACASSLCAWVGCLCMVLVLSGLLYGFLPSFSLRLTTWFIRVIVLYRLGEITLFAVNWIFRHAGALLSPQRSLAGFLVNITEVILLYAISYLSFACMACSQRFSILTALSSSLRTTITIGPHNSLRDLPQYPLCGSLLMTQMGISYFLTIVVIASIIGILPKRDDISTPPS